MKPSHLGRILVDDGIALTTTLTRIGKIILIKVVWARSILPSEVIQLQISLGANFQD